MQRVPRPVAARGPMMAWATGSLAALLLAADATGQVVIETLASSDGRVASADPTPRPETAPAASPPLSAVRREFQRYLATDIFVRCTPKFLSFHEKSPAIFGARSLNDLMPSGAAPADKVVLDTFDAAGRSGSVRSLTSWVGQVTQHAGSITVGGTALDDNGWGASGLSLNATGMNYVIISGRRDPGNATQTLFIQFQDRTLKTQVFSISTSAFGEGDFTFAQIPIGSWGLEFNPSDISGWSIGGGSVGTVDFRMSLAHLELNVIAIPEPSSLVLIALGALLVGLYRNRRGES